MSWIGWAILIIIVLWFIGKFGSEASKSNGGNRNRPKTNVAHEAQEIADNIETIQQFRSLERKLENAVNRLSEVVSERAYENACHKHDVLQAAFEIAETKIYQWQFIPKIDLDTPKIRLDHAYKVYSNEEYEQLKSTLLDYTSDWYGIDGYGEKDAPEPYLKSLIKFREIIESNDPMEDQIKKINMLVSRNKSLAEEFFDPESSLKPGDEWFVDKLHFAGLPLAYELYNEGYTTPGKCLEIDIDTFASRKGVGPKKLEKLKKFQSAVRNGEINA